MTMTSAWNQLDQLLTCAICLDRYRNPTLLPCQHTFCLDPCLDGLIDYTRRLLKCPECRAEHRIPYKGIQEFPENATMNHFLMLYRDITGEEADPTCYGSERCSICSEKSELQKCAHCDKKICSECREAHIDVLRREIGRINSQVRRGCHRLSDALIQTKKNSQKLEKHCKQIKEEIEDIVRRYSKDLQKAEEKLKRNLEIYTESELMAINKLKEELELELFNMSSNCDLVDNHIENESNWTDVELLEYKEVFLKMLDFLRNFRTKNTDFCRRIMLYRRANPCTLYHDVVDFGELKINSGTSLIQRSISPTQYNSGPLTRSQSDHRIPGLFTSRQTRPRIEINCESETEYDSKYYQTESLIYKLKPDEQYSCFGKNSNASTMGKLKNSKGCVKRPSIEERKSKRLSSPSKTVRFTSDLPHREAIFSIDNGTKGPLSGIARLVDSPRFMERLRRNQLTYGSELISKEPNSFVLDDDSGNPQMKIPADSDELQTSFQSQDIKTTNLDEICRAIEDSEIQQTGTFEDS